MESGSSAAGTGSSFNTNSAPRWGPSSSNEKAVTNQQTSTTQVGGSTYNITNNNNINYNYGANITAISSDSGSVPTFHDLDKNKKNISSMSGGPQASNMNQANQ